MTARNLHLTAGDSQTVLARLPLLQRAIQGRCCLLRLPKLFHQCNLGGQHCRPCLPGRVVHALHQPEQAQAIAIKPFDTGGSVDSSMHADRGKLPSTVQQTQTCDASRV